RLLIYSLPCPFNPTPSPLFPYTTLFRSILDRPTLGERLSLEAVEDAAGGERLTAGQELLRPGDAAVAGRGVGGVDPLGAEHGAELWAEDGLTAGELEEPAGGGVELVDVPARRVAAHHAAVGVALRRERRDLQLLRQVQIGHDLVVGRDDVGVHL